MKIMRSNLRLSASVIGICAALSMQAAMASTGTLTINGLVTASTCNASINGSNPSATTADAAVTLPTVGKDVFGAQGKTAGRTRIIIKVSDSSGTGPCDVPTAAAPNGTVYAHFEPGPSVNMSTGRLISTGTATGVGLQLLNKNYAAIVAGAGGGAAGANTSVAQNSTVETFAVAFSTGLQHSVEYYSEAASVTAGTVTSSVVFTLAYL